MAAYNFDRTAWIGALERALGPLVESATAGRIGLQPLTNDQYRALGEQAEFDTNAREIFDQYLPELNADPTEVVDLLSQHPAIVPNVAGAGKDIATFVEMPSKGFRIEFRMLARHLTRSAIKRGCQSTAAHLERFLTLSAASRVPGYEITVFRGLTMSGETEIAPGLEIVSYQRAADRGLVRNEAPGPTNNMPDYLGMGALVLAREMTWGPCLVPPKTSKDIGTNAVPRFRWLTGHDLHIVFDLISIVTSHRIQVLSVLCCAPEFVDVDPNFGPGSSTGFLHADHWTKKEVTGEHLNQLQDRLRAWPRFDANNRDTLELAVSRLASSIQRNRGRFWVQDRILDAAIALEMMYDLESTELSYKLATRAGHLLADETEKRVGVSRRMKSFYNARSNIAHGSRGKKKKNGKRSNLEEIADSGSDLARKTLWKLLERGDFPDWERLVMSG